MGEMLPNPMPEDVGEKHEVDALLETMNEREAQEMEKIASQLQEGRTPQEILDDMGDYDEAVNIIGPNAAEDLRLQVEEDKLKEKWIQRIHNELQVGRSPEYLLEELGGYEEAIRTIGAPAAQDLRNRVEQGQSDPKTRTNQEEI